MILYFSSMLPLALVHFYIVSPYVICHPLWSVTLIMDYVTSSSENQKKVRTVSRNCT